MKTQVLICIAIAIYYYSMFVTRSWYREFNQPNRIRDFLGLVLFGWFVMPIVLFFKHLANGIDYLSERW